MTVGAATPVRWGTRTTRDLVRGHELAVFADRPRGLADLLAHELAGWGDRTALVQAERRVGYGQLVAAAAGGQRCLADAGVRAGDRVLLLGPASTEWVVAFWAMVRAGVTVVIGNGWWSRAEIDHACRRTQPTAVVAGTDRADQLPPGLGLIPLDTFATPETGSAPPAGPPSAEDSPAVILFTSGTTGAPRAAELSHRALIAGLQCRFIIRGGFPDPASSHGRPAHSRLISTPLFHIGGLTDLLFSLVGGDRIVLLRGRFDPREVLEVIERERVASWGAVPTMASRVLDEPTRTQRDSSSLRHIGLGGAAVPAGLRARLADAFPSLRARTGVVWGLSEAGGVVSIGSDDDLCLRPGCVGRPLPTFEVRVMPSDEPGCGELLVRSPTLMTGYWGEVESPIDADGWLHTGDLGRIDEEGFVYLTGRAKDLIIRGGENVAAPHVEAWLLSQPEVNQVAVVGLPHEDLGEEVAAAVQVRPGAQVAGAELAGRARDALARFAIPSRWWFTADPLPMNDVGKVDKRTIVRSWPDGS